MCLCFISFSVLVGSLVQEYTHSEFFINFHEICLDSVVFARINPDK